MVVNLLHQVCPISKIKDVVMYCIEMAEQFKMTEQTFTMINEQSRLKIIDELTAIEIICKTNFKNADTTLNTNFLWLT